LYRFFPLESNEFPGRAVPDRNGEKVRRFLRLSEGGEEALCFPCRIARGPIGPGIRPGPSDNEGPVPGNPPVLGPQGGRNPGASCLSVKSGQERIHYSSMDGRANPFRAGAEGHGGAIDSSSLRRWDVFPRIPSQLFWETATGRASAASLASFPLRRASPDSASVRGITEIRRSPWTDKTSGG